MNSDAWLEISRSVRFSDTDAAGVVHFQQLLGWCHQAWEESLERFGLEAGSVFPGGRDCQPGIALPIIHCHADFQAPLKIGDHLLIRLEPRKLDIGCFEVISRLLLQDREVASGCLRHAAINAESRRRCALPEPIDRWLEASAVGQIQPL